RAGNYPRRGQLPSGGGGRGGGFAAWLTAASGQTITASGTLTADAAAKLLHDAAMASGRNFEWLGEYTDAADFVVKSGMAKAMPSGTLTRADAAALVKGYYHVIPTAGVPAEGWTLTFQDEFEGTSLDWNTWISDRSAPGHILSTRWPSNVEVRDGLLRLLTKKEKIAGYETKDWTTGNVWVNPSVFRQKGGWWEASMKINAAGGLNNAFWMINAGKEIDIVEAHYTNAANTNLHVTENGQKKQYSDRYVSRFDLSADFHTYALHWTEKELVFYLDGEEIARKVNYGADTEMWPYFSTAVLNWAGKITDAADGQAMEVEWVRIYQEK
ncbi:MAG: glycoside hydrolase family 16 protein, partial [Clostridia bacterium]|nr:glycoside hydrolase family 16 protein [Clostridia bacterium]